MNKQTKKSKGFLLILCLPLLLQCCAPFSNAQRSSNESFTVRVVKPSYDSRNRGPGDTYGAFGVETLLLAAADYALKELIDYQAGTYTQKSSVSVNLDPDVLGPLEGIDGSLLVLVTRTYKDTKIKSSVDFSKGFLEEPLKKIYGNVADADLSKEGWDLNSQVGRKVSFCALLRFSRLESEVYTLELLAYSYPVLKANSLPGNVPFTKADDIKSVLTVSLKGPQATQGYPGGIYSVVGNAELKWQKGGGSWQYPIRKGMLKPVRVFTAAKAPSKAITLGCILNESSDMTKTLEGLKDDVDVESWIGGDDSTDSDT